MSKQSGEVLEFGVGFILIILAIFMTCWTFGMVTGAVGNWWSGVVKDWQPTPEERAAYEKQRKEWENDPMNPDVQMRRCAESGGYPEYHFWKGGNVTCEKDNSK